MRKVRWGVLSTANIGTGKVIPAMQRGELTEVIAIASREQAIAEAAARRLGIPRALGSYEALLADPEVEAVYIPLPNHLHVPWAQKALAAGKHVLCEKPIARTAAEAQTLLDTAQSYPHLKVMEAFMYRFHPQWQRARELTRQGAIGELRTVHSFFSYYLDDPTNIRNIAEAGGGAIYDVGCYSISLARFIFEGEPTRVSAIVEDDPRFQTDRLTSALLDFGRGTSTFTVGTQLTPYQRVNIFGTRGRIEIEIPFNAPPDRDCKLWLTTDDGIEEITFPAVDQYTLQADAVSRAILDDSSTPTPLSDAVANMKVIEAVLRSARSGRWEANT
ncbi:MAG TPA: Gfo/Idh/MocA family oxidoreductase [Ktedonobacterales bacterium]